MAPTPEIGIIGAGPAGLTLARLLHVSKDNVNVEFHELDASLKRRFHFESGRPTVRAAGVSRG